MIAGLEVTTPADLAEEVPAIVAQARELCITTPEAYEDASGFLKSIKGAANRVAAFFKPTKQKIDESKKAVLEMERQLAVPLAEAERLTKAAMLDYQHEQDRKAEAERRRLQAIADEKARKEREIAEQAAAKQRAIEAEARAKAEQARREAEQASAAERKRLLDEAAKAERAANAALAKQEQAQEKAAAVVAPVISVASTAPKAAGISVRKTWKAEVVDMSAFLAYVLDTRRADLVVPNEAVLQALAKGLKEAASMPGVKFSEVSNMAASGR